MGRKRFITSDMSIDERIAGIAAENPVAALMWPWFITGFDDWGRMEAVPMKIKLSIFPAFPYTAKDIEQAIELYADFGLVHKYEVDRKQYVAINPAKFYKYQTYIRNNKRESDDSNCPPPPNSPWGSEEEQQSAGDSVETFMEDNLHEDARTCAQGSEDERICIPSPSPSPSPSLSLSPSVYRDILSSAEQPTASDPVPYQEIVAKYNEICVSLPKVREITKERRKHIKARWKEHPDIEFFCALFRKAEESSFLSGRDGKWTSCNFDWLMNAKNMTKVIEGTYDNRVVPIGNTGQRAAPQMNEPKGFAGIREFMERVKEKGALGNGC